jgi:hypothetical protein
MTMGGERMRLVSYVHVQMFVRRVLVHCMLRMHVRVAVQNHLS